MSKWLREQLRAVIPAPLLNLRFAFGAPLAFRPGHFYSPICDPADLARHYHDPARSAPQTIPGIDLREQAQRELWASWRQYLQDFPFPDHKRDFRYYCQNRHFGVGDAIVLYCMLRHFRPRRVIEIGSGFSSACMVDTIERNLDRQTRCTFIEPHPELLHSLLNAHTPAGHTIIIPKAVQDMELATFDQLQANDILFIDSTHILKTGSDVAFELFDVLPRLRPGVIIHIHDIFYPFEYPREWVIDRNYSWNEIYAVRALLMNNPMFEILFFNDHFAKCARDLIERDAPRMLADTGGSLWLRSLVLPRP
ncbi:class I SAM-dependent methyltransferase [Bradyrhizobium sp. ARR65]|uniref:class I SAM-dependent methyltransferase n=1 Tax=Bradyrhizobium sp. ARR65 TaxID=1040989 RepID=UPI000466E83C|nr:class I SAM-dependent methyltransferase [Bradyrhizobium sp. ARR65]